MLKRIYLITSVCLLNLFITNAFAAPQNNLSEQTIGEAKVIILNDVTEEHDPTNILVGASAEDLKTYLPNNINNMVVQVFLVQVNGKNILIDTGFGKKLTENLTALKIAPENIDTILITHLHPDHIGGLLTEDGKPLFSKATVYVANKEKAFWFANPEAKQVQLVVNAYQDKIHLFEPESLQNLKNDLIPGFKAIATYGHTPGHTSYLLESAGNKLLFWGDITHITPIQFPKPEVAVIYDSNPNEAIEIRKVMLNFVSEQKIPVAGAHVENIILIKPDNTKAGSFIPVNFK